MYREPRAPRPLRVVRYGWFAPRLGRVAFGALCLILGAVIAGAAASPAELACVRPAGGGGSCVFKRIGQDKHFSIEAISEVRARDIEGPAPKSRAVVLIDRHGRELALSWSDSDAAGDALERASSFFAEASDVPRLELAEGPSFWGPILTLAFLIGGALVGKDAFRGSGAWNLVVDLDAQRVTALPSRFGWPGKPRVHALDGVRDVRVELGTLRDRWKTRGQSDERGARLVLVAENGVESPLTTGFLRAASQRQLLRHERARVELLRALELEPDPEAASTEPAPAEASSARGLRARWAGLSKSTRGAIAFFGAVMAFAVVAQIAVEIHAARTGGFLEVDCVRRCRFAGAECLPGGSFRMGLAAGSHTLEVYDPDTPSKWRPLVASVELGTTTELECK